MGIVFNIAVRKDILGFDITIRDIDMLLGKLVKIVCTFLKCP